MFIPLAILVLNLGRPILHVEKFWIFGHAVSIWSGMMTLYRAGEALLAGLILVFSIVIPIGNPWLGQRSRRPVNNAGSERRLGPKTINACSARGAKCEIKLRLLR